MKVQEYISSGIIESYVLDLASLEERIEFESMCRQYHEIKMARIAFEKELENHAIKNGVTPSSTIKQKILNQVNSVNQHSSKQKGSISNITWMKYAAAASIVLLAGSLYWSISLYNQNKKLKDDLNNSVAKLNDMEKDIQVLQQNPNVKMASMKGMEISPASYATVYWDTASQDVYLMINNMPKPPSEMQYQLWAFLNGQPIDMGLIEITEKPLQLYRLKKAQASQAFAITLEKRDRKDVSKPGGDVYVMGKL